MSNNHKVRAACAALAMAGSMAAVLGSSMPQAWADTDTGSTTANVVVGSSITLTGLTSSFTLTGSPGQTPTTGATPVTMTVTTNNFAGYNVTVVPRTVNLTPALPGNTDVIPSNSLEVDGPVQGGTYTGLTFGVPLVVATKAAPSAALGDPITNNYRMTIPFVRPDTYSGVLDYVATTL